MTYMGNGFRRRYQRLHLVHHRRARSPPHHCRLRAGIAERGQPLLLARYGLYSRSGGLARVLRARRIASGWAYACLVPSGRNAYQPGKTGRERMHPADALARTLYRSPFCASCINTRGWSCNMAWRRTRNALRDIWTGRPCSTHMRGMHAASWRGFIRIRFFQCLLSLCSPRSFSSSAVKIIPSKRLM
ncbi:hypothetical protein EI94DRAFT_313398 [Lactarius quietus]|nr:hypothetical protein EI94DRAFT_313398 [Lactarius quietus]